MDFLRKLLTFSIDLSKPSRGITIDGEKVQDDYIVLCRFDGVWKVMTTAPNMRSVIKNMQEIWNDGKPK